MIRMIHFGNLKVWLLIQQLYKTHPLHETDLIAVNEFVCYFKFTEPTTLVIGELLRDADNKPIVFETPEAAEEFAKEVLAKKFRSIINI